MNLINEMLEEKSTKSDIEIYGFYDVLLKLFNQLDLISFEANNQSKNQFAFIRAFPDQEYLQNNVVTFLVKESNPFTSKSLVNKTGNTIHTPRFVDQEYDIISGNVKDTYRYPKEHCLELRCFSRSAETVEQLSKIIETSFIVYSSLLKKYVSNIRYLHTTATEYVGEYDQKRLFTKSIYFKIITVQTYNIDLEQLKNITLTLK